MRADARTLIPYWIQRADGSVQDHAAVPLDRALAMAQTHNWEAERAKIVAVQARGGAPTAPSIGFAAGTGADRRLLQACPTGKSWTVNYHFTVPVRLFRREPRTAYRKDCSWLDTEFAIRAFFNGRHDQLLNILPGVER